MSTPVDKTQSVRPGEELPLAALEAYLLANISDTHGPLVVEQFPGGSSNLTYLLRLGDLEMVLRRPPFGNRVKSAHDMGREYKVLSKLCSVFPPAPKPFVYCEDESVIGAPFYCMERRRGVVLRNTMPRDFRIDPETMRKLNYSFLDTLVAFHKIDYQAAGLGDLGKPVGYLQRQVEGWTKRYLAAATEQVEAMDKLIKLLPERMPQQPVVTLVHNDYKFDNVMLDANDLTKIVAVLDWEMCTVGDPMTDLGTVLCYWAEPTDKDTRLDSSFVPTLMPGSLTRRQVVEYYTEKSGIDTSEALYYYAFGLFKVAGVVQQIYWRYANGHTKDERFAKLNGRVASMSKEGLRALEEGTY